MRGTLFIMCSSLTLQWAYCVLDGEKAPRLPDEPCLKDAPEGPQLRSGVSGDASHVAYAIAHRGASGDHPENTYSALQGAIDQGSEGIETDLRWLSDGSCILMHDTTLDRTTDGTGACASRDLEYVSRLDAGSWFGEEFAGEPVPELHGVLDFFIENPGAVGVFDLKEYNFDSLNEVFGNAADRDSTLPDRVMMGCWDDSCVEQAQKMLPEYTRMLITPALPDVEEAAAAGYDVLSISYQTLLMHWNTKKYISRAQELGLEIFTWTPNSERAISRVLSVGVNGVVTDYPELVIALRDSDLSAEAATPYVFDPIVKREWLARVCRQHVDLLSEGRRLVHSPMTEMLLGSASCQQVLRQECVLGPHFEMQPECAGLFDALSAEFDSWQRSLQDASARVTS